LLFSDKTFEGKTVVITGASAGVGRAAVREFAKQGARLALLARGEDGLQGAVRDAEDLGAYALAIPTDVAHASQVENAAERIEQEFGPIDIWVNNAMTTVFAPVHETKPDDFHRATEVTYLGTVYGTMAALKRMIPRDTGTIVQVGSALAYRGIPLQAAYCGAKHGIRGFTDALRCELLHDHRNIHLTMVQLPALNTTQFNWCKSRLPNHPQPIPPIFQPELAARAIVWAACHRRREVQVARSTVRTIWGNKFLPKLGDWTLARRGYDGQQTDERVAQNRPCNLYQPVPGDHGAHGIFDERATDRSWQWWLTTHRGLAMGATAATALLLGMLVRRSSR
jgi:NAD(P)-dependent dehydrogenase (short-subunit alcohol dehydrogenase family)